MAEPPARQGPIIVPFAAGILRTNNASPEARQDACQIAGMIAAGPDHQVAGWSRAIAHQTLDENRIAIGIFIPPVVGNDRAGTGMSVREKVPWAKLGPRTDINERPALVAD